MSASSPIVLALIGAGLLFLLQMALSVILAAASTLTSVALHRLSNECGPRYAFLESLQDTASPQRMATAISRQLALIGGTLWIAFAGQSAGWRYPGVVALAGGTLVGVLFLEAFAGRALAVWEPRAILRRMAFLVPPAHLLLYPVVHPLSHLLNRLGTHQQSTAEEREEEQEEEVEAYIEVGEREGILEASESKMMRSIVDLSETYVREIMTPRTDIVALPGETTIAQARRTFVREGHSRLPVHRETIDDVAGVLHVRDVLRLGEEGKDDEPISDHLRDVMFVPETLSVAHLLAEMRVKSHIAMVVDEYGGVAGLITLEDLLEEIVGDIRDEHDLEEVLVRREQEGAWLVDGAAHVAELEQLFGLEFAERDFDTVGGLVVSELGRVPSAGESIDTRGLHIEVVKADRRRIRLLRVSALKPSSEVQAGP